VHEYVACKVRALVGRFGLAALTDGDGGKVFGFIQILYLMSLVVVTLAFLVAILNDCM